MNVLIYGGTGSQMRPLARQLLELGLTPRVLSRNPIAAAPLFPQRTQIVAADLETPRSLLDASRGIDAVAFMLPAFLQHPERALQYAADAARAAADAGVKLIVWNTSARYPLPGEHRASDTLLLATHERLASAGVPVTVIAPTTYMENLLGPWTLSSLQAGYIAYPVLPERRMGWIASNDVCALIAAAIQRPDLAGRLYRVSGTEAPTGPELARAFSEVLQRPLLYRTLSPQEMKMALEQAYGPGAGDEVAQEYALDQADADPPLKHYDMSAVLADLPVRMTGIREWIADHRQAFDSASR